MKIPPCPSCSNVLPDWAIPDEPTDEGGAEFYCPVPTCMAHLYMHCDWVCAGPYRNKIEVLP